MTETQESPVFEMPSTLKDINLSNARAENETFEDYKERRKRNNRIIKTWKKGRIAWGSDGQWMRQGTYIKEKHGVL